MNKEWARAIEARYELRRRRYWLVPVESEYFVGIPVRPWDRILSLILDLRRFRYVYFGKYVEDAQSTDRCSLSSWPGSRLPRP